jgi:cell division protein FtsB
MRNFLAPEKIRQTKRYLILSACCLVALLAGAHEIFGHNGYLARRRHRIQIETLTSEMQKLKQENIELTRKIQDLRSDPDTIEKLAREQLRLGRPGDVVITLNPSQQSPPPANATSK